MVIRPSLPQDAEAIALLSSQLGYPVSASQVAALQVSLLRHPDHLVLVAEDEEGKVRGWVHVFISRRVFVLPFAELGGIVVEQAQRRSGIGSAMLARAEQWASEAGCSIFRIRSNTRRLDADRFYRAAGYELSKTQSVFEKTLARVSHSGGV